MSISEERFNQAAEVIEAGVTAAAKCGEDGLNWEEAFDMLTGGMRGKNLSVDALLELLGVALMKLAVERLITAARQSASSG